MRLVCQEDLPLSLSKKLILLLKLLEGCTELKSWDVVLLSNELRNKVDRHLLSKMKEAGVVLVVISALVVEVVLVVVDTTTKAVVVDEVICTMTVVVVIVPDVITEEVTVVEVDMIKVTDTKTDGTMTPEEAMMTGVMIMVITMMHLEMGTEVVMTEVITTQERVILIDQEVAVIVEVVMTGADRVVQSAVMAEMILLPCVVDTSLPALQ